MKECYARMIANDFENDITAQWLYGKSMEEKWMNTQCFLRWWWRRRKEKKWECDMFFN